VPGVGAIREPVSKPRRAGPRGRPHGADREMLAPQKWEVGRR